MIGALAALLLAGAAPEPEPVLLDLNQLMDRADALDGRLVEFDGYVRLMGTQNSHPLLSALTGEYVTLRDGRRVVACADNSEASAAILMRGTGLAPLTRRTARPNNGYAGVRIRAILRNRSFGWRSGGAEHEWVKLLDEARVVRVTGERCLINLPEGARPLHIPH